MDGVKVAQPVRLSRPQQVPLSHDQPFTSPPPPVVKAGSDLFIDEICRRVSSGARPAEPSAVREVIALTHQVWEGKCDWRHWWLSHVHAPNTPPCIGSV